ncbi:CHC2 zinc finger domain-containing protein [Niveispirillum sp.]|uniref:CHC2 zinc finger domain-containing protein n=1 Tax=Niveispirillum sp. TaxID=1917217 RepID=UPI001B792B21|nr:CHC2 zinc finger domain-containing protein [Niveispirillum sp.]MBP7339436.1 hypothetical protein [Niveispirillum sp.]
MQRHDPDLIRRVKKAAPLLVIISRHVTLTGEGDVRRGRCPLRMDMQGGFRLDLKRREWECACCQDKGDILDFVQIYDRVDFNRALAIVAQAGGVDLPRVPGGPVRPRGGLL